MVLPYKMLWLLLLLVTPVSAQTDGSCCGLLFQSYQVAPNLRTSLRLLPNAHQWAGDLDLEFELSFWDPGKFGYIFRAVSANGEQLDLLYTPEEFALKLILNEEAVVAAIPFEVDDIIRNRWHAIKIHLGQEIGIEVQGQYLARNLEFDLVYLDFGVTGRQQIQTAEALPMALRSLVLKENQEITHFWPLNETQGSKAYDQKGSWDLVVNNPLWMANKNSYWEQRAEMDSDYFPALSFDSTSQSLFLFNTDKIQVFNLHSNQWLDYEGHGRERLKQQANFGIYNPYKQEHILYDAEPLRTMRYRADANTWQYDSVFSDPKPYHWKHVQFINAHDSALYIFGGYGYFESRNTLQKEVQGKWHQVPLRGDKFAPRYHLALALIAPNKYYLFGGLGNETGSQELGFRNYYDLHVLDLSDSTITKVGEFEEPQEHFLPAPHMVYDSARNSLYTLAYRNFDTQSQGLTLLKLDLEQFAWQQVSDSILYDRPGVDLSDAFLWSNPRTKELLTAVRLADDQQSSTITIYSLNFPPLPPAEPQLPTGGIMGYLWAGLIILLLTRLSYAKIKPRARSNKKQAAKNLSPSPSLQVLGAFAVHDARGSDLSRDFSPKLQELLMALLIGQSRPQEGIDTQTLTEWIWPDLSASKAKNARGVNFKRLREALRGMPMITIDYEEDLWKLKLSPDVYCDYQEFLKLKQDHEQRPNCEKLIDIVQAGPLTPHLSAPWLESYRAQFSNQVIDRLVGCSHKAYQVQEYSLLERLADGILTFDDLSEEGLRMKVLALVKTGKSGVALQFYESFAQRYEKLLGSSLGLKFSEINSLK